MYTVVFQEMGRLRIIQTQFYDAYLAVCRGLRRDGLPFTTEEP